MDADTGPLAEQHPFLRQLSEELGRLAPGPQRLAEDQRRPAIWIELFILALAMICMRHVEPDRSCILRIHMQPQRLRTYINCRAFHPSQEFPASAFTSQFLHNLNRCDVANKPARLKRPLHDGEPAQPPALLRNPGRGIGTAHNLLHIPTSKTKRRLEANLLNRIKRVKILRGVETIEHSPTLRHSPK